MTRPRPDERQRETRRQHLARLDAEPDPTISQRILRDRLRHFDDADQAGHSDEAALRRALGLQPSETPTSTNRRGGRP